MSRLPASIACLVVALPAQALAQVTYRNDSLGTGGDGAVVCGFVVGEKFASVFVPPPGDYPFVVEEVHFLLAPYRQVGTDCVLVAERTDIPITVEIWNDDEPAVSPPRAPIYTSDSWAVASSAEALNVLDIRSDSELRIEAGVVRVAITLTADDIQPIRDVDGPTAERNLILDDSGTWHWADDLSVAGDWLLRLVVTPEGGPDEDVEPVPDAVEDAPPDSVEDDVPADVPDDDAGDAGEDQEGSLGGGGCSCSVASHGSGGLPLALLLAMALIARRRTS